MDSLLELTALEDLCLAGCPISGAGVAAAAESFSGLTSLSLERCYGINDVCFEVQGLWTSPPMSSVTQKAKVCCLEGPARGRRLILQQ